MFFYSLSILSCSLWRSVDCLLKNLWDIFAELILYAWENHAKRRKRGKSNLIFHFSPFSVAFEPNKDSTLSVVERGLISVAFSLSCSFLCVREAVDVFLAEFFPSGQVPQHTQHNRLLYNIEKMNTVRMIFGMKVLFFLNKKPPLFLDKVYRLLKSNVKRKPNWLDLVESNKVESNLLQIFVS